MNINTDTDTDQKILVRCKNVGINFKRRSSLLKVHQAREFWALKDVSFEVRKGEVLGVIGKNGAGKSTILSILAGIFDPDRGTIEHNTKSVSLLSLQAGFIPYLSGRKNIYLNGLLLGLSLKEIKDKINDIIKFSELEDFIDEPVDSYSSGMKTRLGFSSALYVKPDIILIDEVLGVGDASFKKKSTDTMKERLAHGDTTAVVVSHNEGTIKDLCDRAVWIEKGKSVFEGSPDDAIKYYNDFIKTKKIKT